MRPTPAEVAAGIARILGETVAPAVTDAHARAQLAQVIAVLGQVPWDDAAFVVQARTAATFGLLADCQSWVDAQPDRIGVFGAAAGETSRAGASLEAPASFAEANSRLEDARATLEQFIRTLQSWRAESGPDDSDALLARLVAALTT